MKASELLIYVVVSQFIYRQGNTAKLAFDPPCQIGTEEDQNSDDCTIEMIEAGPAGEGIVGAFSGCSSLSEIALPPNLTKIGGHAFQECTSLGDITLPAGPVDIGQNAFRDCPGTPRRPGD